MIFSQSTTPILDFHPLPREGMRTRLILAATLAATALLLPPRELALALTGGREELVSHAVTGAWIFKAFLAIHAAMLLLAGRIRPFHRTAVPLVAPLDVRQSAKTSKLEWTILFAILIVGAALRMYALGEGLWHDEIAALVNYVRFPAGVIITTFDSQNQHMLYSLLGRLSVLLFGESAWAMRLPAALFGIASLWATYWFGTHVTTRREALMAAALLAASYHHVWFSQNARGYSALLFWTLVSSGLFLRMLRRREAYGWVTFVPYAVVTALAIYTQMLAIFVTAAHFLIWTWLIVRQHRRSSEATSLMPLAAFVLATTLTVQLYALAMPQFFHLMTAPQAVGTVSEWKNPLWFVSEMLRGLSGGLAGGIVIVAGVAAVVGGTGVASYWRRSGTVVAMLLLPGLITMIAMVATSHNLWPRLFFFCAGFAVLIAIRGVFAIATLGAAFRAPALATAALVLLASASATTVPKAWRPKQDYGSAFAFVERVREAGDAVVVVDMSRLAYERYIASGWTPVENPGELESIEESHRRTWVVYAFPARLSAVQPEIWKRLEDSYAPAARFPGTVGGGTVVVKVFNKSGHESGARDRPRPGVRENLQANGVA
ncbi:MAG: glycosyltransferase family 39 protein [Gemmatimonadaceae bacterium]|nr:glycosyltransferase family 39 protein [Gemmatimonadaceae bacterium]